MPDDEPIIEAYEQEFAAEAPSPRRSNRGFWLVMGAFLVTSVFLVGEIWSNRGIKESIAHAQFSLTQAQALAERIQEDEGSLADADADALAEISVGGLTYVGPDTASDHLDMVSVAAGGASQWAAAVQVRPGACFYLHLDDGEIRYGAGTECTGLVALEAVDPRW